MAIKKSDIYRSLWESCDQLRGGMDASLYKDYILTLLFVKYVSDRAGQPDALIEVPEGASFSDMKALRGAKNIGEGIDTIIARIAEENDLSGVVDRAFFNDPEKFGRGQKMINTLTALINIFSREELNFSKNRADGDDILGDAYEYLMRNFATEAGKSKGQFYTPAEVSRVVAAVAGVSRATSPRQSVYDPTCGSGSLLLKAAETARLPITIFGQEMDIATRGLARMNMIMHNRATAEIAQGDVIAEPHFLTDAHGLQTFDFVVANPPFSAKAWAAGLTEETKFGRFVDGDPPAKNGDFAFLLHILASMKATGSGAVILPHGVLFRGNAEARLRERILRRGYIKGVIGLPANLFYGTGIPASIIVLDKAQAQAHRPVFMIDASKGFIKDGNKNRLRERDIHKIIDAFTRAQTIPGYSRLVPFDEIARNDFNMNIPRYIDGSDPEDLQDISAHLHGGVPGVVAGLERVIAKKRLIKQGAMQDLLTARRRLPGFSGEWEAATILDAAHVDPEALGAGTPKDYGFRYISLEDVKQGVLSGWADFVFGSAPSRARRILRKDDVLLGTVRPNLRSHNANIEPGLLRPWLTARGHDPEIVTKAIAELQRAARMDGLKLYEANRATYDMLRYGVQVTPGPGEAPVTVRFVDWDNPAANDFGLAEEVAVAARNSKAYNKRPDLVMYVNGIAMGVVELKKSTVDLGEGIRQTLDNQRPEFIRHFFTTVQITFAGNDMQGLRYGAIQTPQPYWLAWKEDSAIALPLDRDVSQMMAPARFLELIDDFILFDAGIKKVARPNQYFAVKAAQEAVAARQGGMIWQTQGSGKSLIMVMLARWIRETRPDARVLVITDRKELDEQIESVFGNTGDKVRRAKSGADLLAALADPRHRVVASLVHKFAMREEDDLAAMIADIRHGQTGAPVGEFFVFIDEAHRTQSGKLARAMRSILPGAVFYGFTGKQLLRTDKQTSIEVFGPYIGIPYRFNEAVEDGVVLDLRYEARDIDQRIVSSKKVDDWFEARTKALTPVAKAALKQRWGTLQRVLSSRDRLEQIASDIILDMELKLRLKSGRGNAMLVAGSISEACRLFEVFRNSGSHLAGKCAIMTSYTRSAGELTGEEAGMGETEKQYVYRVYDRLMTDLGTDEEAYEAEVLRKFRMEPAQMKLLIVVSRLLTGFDAPPATYIYIDKQMRDHGLFSDDEAICAIAGAMFARKKRSKGDGHLEPRTSRKYLMLLNQLRGHLRIDTTLLDQILANNAVAREGRKADKHMTAKNRKFCEMVVENRVMRKRFLLSFQVLRKAADSMLAQAEQEKRQLTGHERARVRMLGVAACFAAIEIGGAPIRVKNAMGLTCMGEDAQIRVPQKGKKPIQVLIPAALTKNGATIEFPIRANTHGCHDTILWYLCVIRPLFGHADSNPYLFPAVNTPGVPLSEDYFGAEFAALMRTVVNLPMTPHQMRHGQTSLLLDRHPNEIEVIAKRIDDMPDTLRRYYGWLNALKLVERGQDLLVGLMDE